MRALLLALVLPLHAFAESGGESPVGFLVDFAGAVTLENAEKRESAAGIGDGIWKDDVVKTGSDSWAVIHLPRSSSRIVRIGADATWRAGEIAAEPIPWVPSRSNSVPGAPSRGEDDYANLLLPRFSKISRLPFRISWRIAHPQIRAATLEVRDESGVYVGALTGDRYVDVLESLRLEPGRTYRWRLHSIDGAGAEISAGTFYLLSEPEFELIENRLLEQLDASIDIDRVVLRVGLLVDQQLYVDAASVLIQSGLKNDNKRLFERLMAEVARLSSEMSPRPK